MMAKIITHNKSKPDWIPAKVHVVRVPGPIKAAAIKVLGPKYFFQPLVIGRF
jgi:hypothetical protein